MMRLKRGYAVLAAAWLGGMAALGADSAPSYQQDFSQTPVGAAPEELLVLDGQFSVKEDGGNRFLELPGAPLDTYGFLFGPSRQSGMRVSARIRGSKQGRKFPVFAVGLAGAGGFRLQVSPAKQAIELLRADAVLASAPFAWKSGGWTRLTLELRKAEGGAYKVEGKVWGADDVEPAQPQISQAVGELPPAGRCGAWGMPFSGTAIQFDDLSVSAVP